MIDIQSLGLKNFSLANEKLFQVKVIIFVFVDDFGYTRNNVKNKINIK